MSIRPNCPAAVMLACLLASCGQPVPQQNRPASSATAASDIQAASAVATASAASASAEEREYTDAELENIEQTFASEAERLAAGLPPEEAAKIKAQAARLAELVRQAQNIKDSNPDVAILMLSAEYRDIAMKAHDTNIPYTSPDMKPVYEKLKKDAPDLNIQGVGKSKLLPENFVHVLIIDNATNQPHFAVYSRKGEYLVFSALPWGKSFFNKDGSPMTDDKARRAVAAEFAQTMNQIRKNARAATPAALKSSEGSFETAANFLDRSHLPHGKDGGHYALLLSDMLCNGCNQAEYWAAAYAQNPAPEWNKAEIPALLRRTDSKFQATDESRKIADAAAKAGSKPLWNVLLPSDTALFPGDKGLEPKENRLPILAAANCNSGIHMNISYGGADDYRRTWSFGKDETKKIGDSFRFACGQAVFSSKALAIAFGIKPHNLPLLVSDTGLQLSGKFSLDEFIEFMTQEE